MAQRYDILVVGELNADLILTGDTTPRFGQVEQLIDDAALVLGSSSAIFACGAARLGLGVGFVGKVGDDALGHFVVGELQARGVDTAGVVVDPAIKTGLSVIFSRPGDRAILTYAGSIAALRYPEIDLQLLAQARHLHLGSFFLLDALRPDVPALFAAAKGRGLTVSLDTNYDPAERWADHLAAALAHVDVFLPNEAELLAISGAADLDGARAALRDIPTVAVKLGAQGAVGWQGDREERVTPPPVRAVDTTGAGDSFDAGFIYGYLRGWELARSLRLGCACGALSTRAAGGTAAQATLDEAQALV
jgi:sugar/nucleoside kinase (ribokinase family)